MVSCKRGTHLSKKCGFVQEGHTFLEKVWFRARGAHISRKSMASKKEGQQVTNAQKQRQVARQVAQKVGQLQVQKAKEEQKAQQMTKAQQHLEDAAVAA